MKYPAQDAMEFENLCQFIRDEPEGVFSILEIGSRHGFSLVRFAEASMALSACGPVVSVDLPEAVWGKKGSGNVLADVVESMQRRGFAVRRLEGNSQLQSVVQTVREIAPVKLGAHPGKYFDFVFIDGDHRYEGVKADFLNYGPLGRIVAFHDIAGDDSFPRTFKGESADMGVPRFWNECMAANWAIKDDDARPKVSNIVTPQSGMGIGILDFTGKPFEPFAAFWA